MGKEMSQGWFAVCCKGKEGSCQIFFRSSLQSSHILGNFSIQMCVILEKFQDAISCHMIVGTFKSKWFHPVTSLKLDGSSRYFHFLEASLLSPHSESQKWEGNNLNQGSYPENTIRKISLAETAVSADGQHSSGSSERLPLVCWAPELRVFRKREDILASNWLLCSPTTEAFFSFKGNGKAI